MTRHTIRILDWGLTFSVIGFLLVIVLIGIVDGARW